MPNAGAYAGKDGSIKVGANVVAKVTGFEYEETVTSRDETSLEDDYEQPKAAVKAVRGNLVCWYDRNDTNGQEALSVGGTVNLTLRHGANSDDPNANFPTALIMSRRIVNGDVNGTVELSIDFTANGTTPISIGVE